jgi:hypothetical protein
MKSSKVHFIKKDDNFNLLEKITDIYIFIIILIFPIIVDKTGFFKILECKYRFFVGISSFYILITTVIFVVSLLRKNKMFVKKLSSIQYFAIIFLIFNIISCFVSPYFKEYNLFIGVGRGEGLITSALYILTFLYVSYFGKFKKKYILYFSISSIFLNLIAILQFIGFNPFNMYQDGIGTHNVSFMTTIGNIDFISAIYTILLSISCGAFIFIKDNKRYENIIHLLSILMGSFILCIIDVLSGKLAFGLILIVILPFIFKNNFRVSKFLITVSTILLGIVSNIVLNVEYHYDLGKLGFYFQFNYIVVLFTIVIISLFILSKYMTGLKYDLGEYKRYLKFYYGLLILGCFVGIAFLYFVPFKSGFLYEIHELLHFNFDDNFGTYRIFLWKRTIPLIKDYLLLGSGPDTFALRFMPIYSDDIAAIGPLTINDTAANIYLTMLINLGILGTISYVVFLISQIVKGIKKINKYSLVLLISILCYMVQSFFNLSVVIVSPIFWMLMGIHHLSIDLEKGVDK